MKVIHARAALLSDYEVLSLLQDMEVEQKKDAKRPTPAVFGTPVDALDAFPYAPRNGSARADAAAAAAASSSPESHLSLQPPNLRSIQADTLLYLQGEDRPCSAAGQDKESIQAFIKALLRWEREEQLNERRLTKGERLMCINLCPRTTVELHCVVEEVSERLSPSQMDHLLHLIAQHFPQVGTDAPTSNGVSHAHAAGEVEQIEDLGIVSPQEEMRQVRSNRRAARGQQRQEWDKIEAEGELEDEILDGAEEEQEDELVDVGARGEGGAVDDEDEEQL